jgi:ribonucleoside-diphosphate reductase alpha chain
MVSVNVDHPDVEKFIDWKVNEEQKVATMVAGSRVLRRHLAAILDAAHDTAASDDEAEGGALMLDIARNRPLRRAIRRARRDGVPELYVQRVLQLAEQGERELDLHTFDTDWQGEAYQSVSGQNSNNSVRLTEEFLAAVRDGRDWSLTRRTDGEVHRTLPANDLWDRIARAAWQSADPGLQFDTTVNEWHTSPAEGRINGSNPCSEYMFLDDTACNLASLNLLPFLDEETGDFDIEAYEHATRLWTVVLEIAVLMAQFPSREIARLSYDYRTLGLGYANLGAMLMVQGIPYDSPAALAWTGALSAILTGESYATSAELAAGLGTFPRFAENREAMLRVVRNHRRAAYAAPADDYEALSVLPTPIDEAECPPELLGAARAAWDRALELGEAHGYRNAQATLIAPTGTIGLLMDCDTTGVEPDFALVKFKKLAGGGYFRIINHAVPRALRRLGYRREQIDEVVAYCVGTGRLEGAPFLNRHTLAQRGFTQPALDRIDEALRTAFHIRFVFNRYTLGDELCRDVLGHSEEELADPGFDLLTALGFDDAQIEAANDHILGRMTIEGAPHLREEHYDVFDCATTCGRYGTRYIEPMAHVRIMAAAQPFLSGAISKTINMPNSATVEEVKQVYMASAESMLKAIALYRDGSKLSQPLAAALFDSGTAFDEEEADLVSEMLDELTAASASDQVLAVAGRLAQLAERGLEPAAAPRSRGSREPLPPRRAGYAQKAKVGGHTIYLHTGDFESVDPDTGRPRLGELFVSMSKDGAAFRSLMNCFAIAVSIGLQHGVPLSAYVDSFVFTKFEPNGIVTGHDRIQMATSIIDYVFRELAISYLGRDDLAHFGPVDLDSGSTAEDEAEPAAELAPAPVAAARPHLVPVAPTVEAPALREGLPASTVLAPERVAERVTSRVTSHVEVTEIDRSYEVVAQARQQGFEGDPCDECGQMMMVRNGTCLKCMNCGSTSGCS